MRDNQESAAPPRAATPGDDYLFGRRATLMVFSFFCLMMVLDFADRMLIASLLPKIKGEWHISDAQSGLLSSALFIGMVVFSVPASLAIDRWSRVKTAGLMGAFWSMASGAGALAQNVGQFVASRAAVGSAQAGYTPAAAAWITAAFPRRRLQFAMGTFSAGQPIGMALGLALGGFMASRYGWRYALCVMPVPGILIASLLYRARDYSTPAAAGLKGSVRPATLRASIATIFRTDSLPFVYVSSAMVVMQMSSVGYFLPSFLTRVHGVPLQTASYMTSAAVLTGIVAAPLGGWLADLWTRRYREAKLTLALLTMLASTALYGVGFGLTHALMWQYGLILAAMFLVTAGISGPLTMTQELVHPGIRALSMTCNALAAHLLGSVPGPVLTGLISDRSNLGFALLCASVFSGGVGAVALLLAKRHYLNDLGRMDSIRVVAAAPEALAPLHHKA